MENAYNLNYTFFWWQKKMYDRTQCWSLAICMSMSNVMIM